MITTSDIADILYAKCRVFEMDIYRRGAIPDGIVDSERIVILPKDQTPQTYWKKSFVEVNICVPDLAGGIADLSRLQELERMAQGVFDGVTGGYDQSHYLISIESLSGVNKDEEMKCHYVNVRLLFEVLNC
jgi:hypothetical protein